MKRFCVALTMALLASSAWAGVIYSDSFAYGNATATVDSGVASPWTSGSGVTYYDHDGGLDHPAMNLETGGALWTDFPENRGSNDPSFSLDLSAVAAGETVWYAALVQYNTSGGLHSLTFAGGTVTDLGFAIDGSGNLYVRASDNGGANANHDTSIDISANGTYLMLLRATQGTGTSPTNSSVDFWFDPANTSSVAALGPADWSTGADSKWGRHTQDQTNISAEVSGQGRTDEIRVGNQLVDVVGIPEPATMGLLSLGGLALLRRRKA